MTLRKVCGWLLMIGPFAVLLVVMTKVFGLAEILTLLKLIGFSCIFALVIVSGLILLTED